MKQKEKTRVPITSHHLVTSLLPLHPSLQKKNVIFRKEKINPKLEAS